MEPSRSHRRLGARIRDPGALYNMGNALGFIVGLAVAIAAIDLTEDLFAAGWERGLEYIAGSPAAIALTSATLVFFWGGTVYTKAWSGGSPPDRRLNQQGDLLSGIGAILLGTGLVMMGNPLLAASAGVLHATGKFGSALGGSATNLWSASRIRVGDLCKDLVLVSRIPAILAGATGLWSDLLPLESIQVQRLLLSLSFIVCCLVWATADWLLLSPEGVIKTAVARVRGSGPRDA